MGAPLIPVSSECQHVHATRWPRQEKLFFLPAFVARTLTPRSQKSVCGLLLECRSGLDAGPFEKTFFGDVETKTPGKIFTVGSSPASQLIGRGRISREGALDVRESRERRDKIVPKFSPEKQKKRNFGLMFSTFLSRIACCSRESTSA